MTRFGIPWPSWRDPRWYQCSALALYSVTAREFFHFDRSHWITLATIVWSVSLDLAIGRLMYGRMVAPLPAVIVAFISTFLLDSRWLWVYLVSVSFSVLSKSLIRFEGRHLFNPGNFALVVMLQFFSPWVTGIPDLFTDTWRPSVGFAVLGLCVAGYARQLTVALSWVGGFVVFALLRSWLLPMPLALALIPILGPALLIFTFHMITDPATTPRTFRFRVAFGLTVAAIDAGFRAAQIPYGPFYALFMVSAGMPWVRDLEAGRGFALSTSGGNQYGNHGIDKQAG